MILNMKRKRILKEREDAVPQRERAARDFVAAIREAEAALEAMKAANDRFYRSDVAHEQSALGDLRHTRERMYQFYIAKEIVAEAPLLSRLLEVRAAGVQAMPFVDFVIHTSKLDLGEAGAGTNGAAA